MLGQVVALAITLVGAQAQPDRPREAEHITDAADDHRRNRRFDEAIAGYRQVLANLRWDRCRNRRRHPGLSSVLSATDRARFVSERRIDAGCFDRGGGSLAGPIGTATATRETSAGSTFRLCFVRPVRTLEVLTFSRWAIVAALALFVLAMLLYPGGTARDPSTLGYAFFQNFGSDLGRTVAFNGRSNHASQIISAIGGVLLMLGIVAGAGGLAAVYSASAVRRVWALAALVAGLLATASVLAAFLIPVNLDPIRHIRLASRGFDIAPLVPLFFAFATARDRRFPIGVVSGWILLTVVLAGFILMRVPVTSDTGLVVQVTAQKIVFVTIAATFVYESFQAARAAPL